VTRNARPRVAWSCLVLMTIVSGSAADAVAKPETRERGPLNQQDSWLFNVSIARVRIDVRTTRLLVTTDLALSGRGDSAGELGFHVAYGAPGTPLAMDAELVATPAGQTLAPINRRGKGLSMRFVASAPKHTQLVLGQPSMAGGFTRISARDLSAAFGLRGAATLRVRSVISAPDKGPDGSRELLVRLGARSGIPLVVGMIEVTGATRRAARWCRREADGATVAVTPKLPGEAPAIVPSLSVRHPNDALCVRLWP